MNETEQQVRDLAKTIARLTDDGEKLVTAVPGLSLFRWDAPTEPASGMYEPSVCMVAQGAKRVLLGSETHTYDPGHYLITSLHLPTVWQVTKATEKNPLLGLRITFDLHEVTQMMVDSDLPGPRDRQSSRAMATGKVSLPLVDAVRRMIDLLDEPQDIPILAPIIQKEIIYRLLVGDQGTRLRQAAAAGSQSQQIGRVVDWLKPSV